MYEAYTSDTANGISIMGPAFTTTSAVATVEVWGASSRSVGSPSMKVERSTTSGECELDFTYGPSHALSFTDNVQPFCRDVGMVVSNMKQIDATHYAVTITNIA